MAKMSNLAGVIGRHSRYKVSTRRHNSNRRILIPQWQAGQEVVERWLAKTAAQYEDLATLLQHLQKLKTSARSANIQVNTQGLIVLATTVATGVPPATVPADILSTLDHVIAGRQANRDWYSALPHKNDRGGHSYCIDALRKVRDLLSGCVPRQGSFKVEEEIDR
jgi:hypothetical protein